MAITMDQDKFVKAGKIYVSRLFKGICEYPFQIAVKQLPHVIRFIAKTNEIDFDAIKYSDVYPAAQELIIRMGAIRRNPEGQPYFAELKLHDPQFDDLNYEEITEQSDIWGS